MRSSTILNCTLADFSNNNGNIFYDSLKGFTARYPFVEESHQQDFYSVLFIDSCAGILEVDHHKIHFNCPKVVIIQPNCISKINLPPQTNGQMISFTETFFSLRYNNNALNDFSFFEKDCQPYMSLSTFQNEHLQTFFELFAYEYNAVLKDKNKVLRSYLNILLVQLERVYNPSSTVKTHNTKNDKVKEFEKLVELHFRENKLPSFYAEKLHVSTNYLNKICKGEVRKTAGDIIRKQITIEAQRLLHYTNLTINQIAHDLGFENVSYFITFFKKQTLVTPEQFRKKESC
ncbi:AraC family transcriptional regulator [Flavobacterium sp. CYK-55]|uniref:helix-turn-helix domain-containing protein n=1 Tax=Flavobacterium sp. CYK-55 TaxID=2835529 RepID=UPI001BCE6AD8|nr:helix-turn-helix domain-containing protein [Flavobacterium sp. CYK-55]MBS7786198.1 AraC family transcriptional regulator [Flavobacterium sp. CYK-55]